MVQVSKGFTNASITLADGQPFDFDDVTRFVPTPFVIAHGLSNVCRYGGQCPKPYTVAEHSVHVSYLVPTAYAFEALMHDASEAFLGDVVTPLKRKLPEYKKLEEELTAYINYCYTLPITMSPIVKSVDTEAYFHEHKTLFGFDFPAHASRHHVRTHPVKFNIDSLTHYEARAIFLRRFEELTGHNHEDYAEGVRFLCNRYHTNRAIEVA